MMVKYVVMVTGANGFLGQHVIKHLQLFTENIKEIRVLDTALFVQKLEYERSKSLVVYQGSITNMTSVRKACNGADIVIHLASLIDWSLFPNWKALQEVNVRGTEVIIESCRQENVPYLIYCSSSAVYNGPEEVVGGNETTVRKPSRYYFEAYATTKAAAQEMVLTADNTDLSNGNDHRLTNTGVGTVKPALGVRHGQVFFFQNVKSDLSYFVCEVKTGDDEH